MTHRQKKCSFIVSNKCFHWMNSEQVCWYILIVNILFKFKKLISIKFTHMIFFKDTVIYWLSFHTYDFTLNQNLPPENTFLWRLSERDFLSHSGVKSPEAWLKSPFWFFKTKKIKQLFFVWKCYFMYQLYKRELKKLLKGIFSSILGDNLPTIFFLLKNDSLFSFYFFEINLVCLLKIKTCIIIKHAFILKIKKIEWKMWIIFNKEILWYFLPRSIGTFYPTHVFGQK